MHFRKKSVVVSFTRQYLLKTENCQTNTRHCDVMLDVKVNLDLELVVTGGYLCIHCIITLIVSILGAIYVQRCQASSIHNSILVTYIKTIWRLRSVYSSVFVHLFDIVTDLIVILQWIREQETTKEINTQQLAIISISIIVFHKIFSAFAIYVTEGDQLRALLQLFDLLLFVEVYSSHKKIMDDISNHMVIISNNINNNLRAGQQLQIINTQASIANNININNNLNLSAIESTMSFKYIRSMEAVFESIPQSVLQLVYVMRVGKYGIVFILSIVQSILSMTNSVLKDDNARGMQGTIWKKYRKRLPPSIKFFQHSICRLSQVLSRITILSIL